MSQLLTEHEATTTFGGDRSGPGADSCRGRMGSVQTVREAATRSRRTLELRPWFRVGVETENLVISHLWDDPNARMAKVP
jgi:hypothetical protein